MTSAAYEVYLRLVADLDKYLRKPEPMTSLWPSAFDLAMNNDRAFRPTEQGLAEIACARAASRGEKRIAAREARQAARIDELRTWS